MTQKQSKTTLEKLLTVGTGPQALSLIIVVLVVLLRPLNLPIPVSQATRDTYNFLNSLPKGSVVLGVGDWGWGSYEDVKWGYIVLLRMMFKHDLRFFAYGELDQPACFNTMLTEVQRYPEAAGKQYGVDFIVGGALLGGEAGMAAVASDVWQAQPTDFVNRRPISSYPMMQTIRNAKDFAAVYFFYAMGTAIEYPIRQFWVKYKVPTIAYGSPGNEVYSATYYPNAGVPGYLAGTRGAAELEITAGMPAGGVASMDVRNTTVIDVLFWIALANIALWADHIRKQQKQQAVTTG